MRQRQTSLVPRTERDECSCSEMDLGFHFARIHSYWLGRLLNWKVKKKCIGNHENHMHQKKMIFVPKMNELYEISKFLEVRGKPFFTLSFWRTYATPIRV